ncbi:MAG: hypothetical protein LRZ87_02600 [Methanocellales archaeon]|nr:hypothetical protein [Methanocellales archaeon]
MVGIKSGSDILFTLVVLFVITLSVITAILVYGIFVVGTVPEWYNAILMPWVIVFSSLLVYCSLRGLVPSPRVFDVGTFIVLSGLVVGIVSDWTKFLLLLLIAISALCLIQLYVNLTSILSKGLKHTRVPTSHIAHLGLAITLIGVILDAYGIVYADGIMWSGCLVLSAGCVAAFYVCTKEPIGVKYIRKRDVKKKYKKQLQEELKKLREGGA